MTEDLITESQLKVKEIFKSDGYFKKNNSNNKSVIHYSLVQNNKNHNIKKKYDLFIIISSDNYVCSLAFSHYSQNKKESPIMKLLCDIKKQNYNLEIYLIEKFNDFKLKYKILDCFMIYRLKIIKMDFLNLGFNLIKNLLLGSIYHFNYEIKNDKNYKNYKRQIKTIKYILKKDIIYKQAYVLIHYTEIIYNVYKSNHEYFILFNNFISRIY